MFQRLLNGDLGELRQRQRPKWPTRSRQPDAPYFIPSAAAHALVNGVVFGVNGQQRNIPQPRFAGKDLARGDHRFLVREANRLSRLDRGISRFQSGHADDGRDDEIHFGERRNRDRPRRPPNHFGPGDSSRLQREREAARPTPRLPRRPTLGRQRTHCSKAASRLRPAASEATAKRSG